MPVKGRGQIVTRQGLADVFGVSVVTVDTWRRNGMPVLSEGSKGKSFEFNTSDCIEWRVREKVAEARPDVDEDGARVSAEEAERRKKVADAGLAELRLAQFDGTLVEASEVESAWGDLMTLCKRRLLALPTKLAPILAIENDAAKIQRGLNDAITDALNELSRGQDAGGTPSDNPEPRPRKTKAAAVDND